MFVDRERYADLLAWKNSPNRKPLVLMGARQVGKTSLLKRFAKQEYAAAHIFDFEANPSLASVFEKDLDTKRILRELAFVSSKPISTSTDLVIFDELQACGRALTSLKYFCEDQPGLSVACAGSLLGLTLSDTSFPVGKVNLLHLAPLTYTEFIRSLGQEMLLGEIAGAFSEMRPIGPLAHEKLSELLKLYLITGGLPEVVSELGQKTEFDITTASKVRKLQQDLILFYGADIAKHSGKINAMHIERLWRAVPEQLARGLDGSSRKFVFKDAVPGLRSYERLASSIDWLCRAGLVYRVPILEHAELPLKAYAHETFFKLFMFDVGMLGAMLQLAPYDLLRNKIGTFKGYLLENFIAQELQARVPDQVFSWRRKESEVDFIIERQGTPLPIEVKAGHNLRARSLKVYKSLYAPKTTAVLSANNLGTYEQSSMYLPLYLADRLVIE